MWERGGGGGRGGREGEGGLRNIVWRRRRKREQEEEEEEEERGKKEEGSWCMRLPATAPPASTLAISPQVMIQSGCSALAGRGTQCELQQRRHAAHQRSGCRAVAPEAQTGGCAISAKQAETVRRSAPRVPQLRVMRKVGEKEEKVSMKAV